MKTYKCYNFSTWKVHMLGKKLTTYRTPPDIRHLSDLEPRKAHWS